MFRVQHSIIQVIDVQGPKTCEREIAPQKLWNLGEIFLEIQNFPKIDLNPV